MAETNLTIVIPCYNEEKVLPISSKKMLKVLLALITPNKISKDNTWEIIESLNREDNLHVNGIKFAHLSYMVDTLRQKMSGNIKIGWSSVTISSWLLSGVQLIGISIGKIYSEVKGCPRFIIEKILKGQIVVDYGTN